MNQSINCYHDHPAFILPGKTLHQIILQHRKITHAHAQPPPLQPPQLSAPLSLHRMTGYTTDDDDDDDNDHGTFPVRVCSTCQQMTTAAPRPRQLRVPHFLTYLLEILPLVALVSQATYQHQVLKPDSELAGLPLLATGPSFSSALPHSRHSLSVCLSVALALALSYFFLPPQHNPAPQTDHSIARS